MKKIIKLTESDLTRIVKRIIKEQSTTFLEEKKLPKPITVKVGTLNVNLDTVKVMKEGRYAPNGYCSFKGLTTDGKNSVGVAFDPNAKDKKVEYLVDFSHQKMRKMFDKNDNYIPGPDVDYGEIGDSHEDIPVGNLPVPYGQVPRVSIDQTQYNQLLQACPVSLFKK